jgi:hypothetical protein
MLLGKNQEYVKSVNVAQDVDKAKTLLENEYALSSESLDNALREYNSFHKYYTPHIMLQMTTIDLTENKNIFAKITHGIKQLISLFTGAQKSTN